MYILLLLFYLVLFFIVAVVVIGTGLLFGRAILAPLLNAARDKGASFRFYTVDMFSLTVMLALPAVLISRFRDADMPAGPTIMLCVIPFALALFAWLQGVSKLSAASVNGSRKRFVFLAVLLPLSFIGAILVPVFILAVLGSLFGSGSSNEYFPFVVLAVAPLVALAGRIVCNWVIRAG